MPCTPSSAFVRSRWSSCSRFPGTASIRSSIALIISGHAAPLPVRAAAGGRAHLQPGQVATCRGRVRPASAPVPSLFRSRSRALTRVIDHGHNRWRGRCRRGRGRFRSGERVRGRLPMVPLGRHRASVDGDLSFEPASDDQLGTVAGPADRHVERLLGGEPGVVRGHGGDDPVHRPARERVCRGRPSPVGGDGNSHFQ